MCLQIAKFCWPTGGPPHHRPVDGQRRWPNVGNVWRFASGPSSANHRRADNVCVACWVTSRFASSTSVSAMSQETLVLWVRCFCLCLWSFVALISVGNFFFTSNNIFTFILRWIHNLFFCLTYCKTNIISVQARMMIGLTLFFLHVIYGNQIFDSVISSSR